MFSKEKKEGEKEKKKWVLRKLNRRWQCFVGVDQKERKVGNVLVDQTNRSNENERRLWSWKERKDGRREEVREGGKRELSSLARE